MIITIPSHKLIMLAEHVVSPAYYSYTHFIHASNFPKLNI